MGPIIRNCPKKILLLELVLHHIISISMCLSNSEFTVGTSLLLHSGDSADWRGVMHVVSQNTPHLATEQLIIRIVLSQPSSLFLTVKPSKHNQP